MVTTVMHDISAIKEKNEINDIKQIVNVTATSTIVTAVSGLTKERVSKNRSRLDRVAGAHVSL